MITGPEAVDEIYVLYPRGKVSGGPEALHQLVDSLRRHGRIAWLVPYPETTSCERHAGYEVYDAPESQHVPDRANVAVLVPESRLPWLRRYRNAMRICWWLSIDSSYLFGRYRVVLNRPLDVDRSPLQHRIRNGASLPQAILRELRSGWTKDVIHLTQSQYAWSYLATRLGLAPSMLSDYTTGVELPVSPVRRSDVVAYNAVKARRLTSPVAAAMPDLEFIAIEGMSRDQVSSTLATATVYIDLGSHPGKDRMPREAALLGCVVSVGMRGAGAFTDDVSIPRMHKVALGGNITENAVRVVRSILQDADLAFRRQSAYRAKILDEKVTFDAQVASIFVRGIREFDTTAELPGS